jgi:uncharacterized protein (TIGR00369 family)
MTQPNDESSTAIHPLVEKVMTTTVPVGELIGFKAQEIEGGHAVILLEAGPRHANPMGTLHGGILCDIADAAMGMAFTSTLAPEESFTTLELRINYFRPFWNGLLRAEAKVVHRGQTIGFIECEVKDEKQRLIAKASSTCTVLRGDRHSNR